MPELQRFYGGDPMAWLATMPIAVVRAYQAMLPRLEAQESLTAAQRTSVGTGRYKPEEAQRLIRAWQRRSVSETSTPAAALADPAAQGSGLGRMGIAAHRVTVTGPRPKVGKGRTYGR